MEDRRTFLHNSALFATGLVISRIANRVFDIVPAKASAAEYRDIRIRTGFGRGPILTAREIQAGIAVTKRAAINEGAHSHDIVITPADFARIQRGEAVRKTSERASGHTHSVTIDPRNIVPGGDVITVPDETSPPVGGDQPGDSVPEQTPDPRSHQLAAVLGEGRDPHLYVEGISRLDENSVKYCLGADCANGNWQSMQLVNIPGRQIFGSATPIQLSDDQAVVIKAITKDGEKVLLNLEAVKRR